MAATPPLVIDVYDDHTDLPDEADDGTIALVDRPNDEGKPHRGVLTLHAKIAGEWRRVH